MISSVFLLCFIIDKGFIMVLFMAVCFQVAKMHICFILSHLIKSWWYFTGEKLLYFGQFTNFQRFFGSKWFHFYPQNCMERIFLIKHSHRTVFLQDKTLDIIFLFFIYFCLRWKENGRRIEICHCCGFIIWW